MRPLLVSLIPGIHSDRSPASNVAVHTGAAWASWGNETPIKARKVAFSSWARRSRVIGVNILCPDTTADLPRILAVHAELDARIPKVRSCCAIGAAMHFRPLPISVAL